MPSKIKTKEDLVRELCEIDEGFDYDKIIREKDLAKKFRKAIE